MKSYKMNLNLCSESTGNAEHLLPIRWNIMTISQLSQTLYPEVSIQNFVKLSYVQMRR